MKHWVRHHRYKGSRWTLIPEPFETLAAAELKLFDLAQQHDPFEGELIVTKPVVIRRLVRDKAGSIRMDPVEEVIEGMEG